MSPTALNFDLQISPDGDGYRAEVVASPSGTPTARFVLPLSPADQDGFIGQLLEEGNRRSALFTEGRVKTFGRHLFNAVFQGEILASFLRSRDRAEADGANLRLRLRLNNVPALLNLPWEFLYDPNRDQFVAHATRNPLIHFLQLPDPPRPTRASLPLRVLIATAPVTSLPHLDADTEFAQVEDALTAMTAAGQVILERMDETTFAGLQKRLADEKSPVHVLHFVGHGFYDPNAGEQGQGAIVLRGADGEPDLVSGAALGRIMLNARGLRLVLLNACEGSRTGTADPFAGVAQTLVQQGIPAVVAMQFQITDQAAIAFAQAFYTGLADGQPIDVALTHARVAISQAGSEWGTPRLFMNSEDGRLWDLAQITPDCPYPGMVPFAEAQADLFFGRDKEIDEAVELLHLHPFLCVIGPSGSGKSSLVNAGVIPALRRSQQFGNGAWAVRMMRPGPTPLTALADALDLTPDDLSIFTTQREKRVGNGRTLLVIDQFEEIFTQAAATDAQAFLDCLAGLNGRPGLTLLLTARADFYPELMGCSLWPAIRANRLDLPPLGRAELAVAIEQPAAKVDVTIDPRLVEQLTGDAANESGALPLVQECLRLLWQGVDRRMLSAQVYADMAEAGRNGLQIAIDRRANVVYNNLPAEDQPLARRIFLRLIQFGEGRADTRRQVAERDLLARDDDPTRFAVTLQTLIDHRLLTASGDEDDQGRRVDVAHEALIAGWTRLRAWIDERRSAEQSRRRLEAAARRWEELDRTGGLLDPVELAEAQRWLAQPDSAEVGGASASLTGLMEASAVRIKQEEREKEDAQQRELAKAAEVATLNAQRQAEQAQARRRTLLLAVALVAAVLVVTVVSNLWRQSQISEAAAVQARATAEVAATAEATARSAAETEAQAAATSETIAQEQRQNAENQRQLAEAAARQAKAGELAGQALTELDLDANGSKALALLLAREAVLTTWERDGTVTDAAMFALNHVVARTPFQMNLTTTDWNQSAVFSPDGTRIVTASYDETAKVWDADSGAELFTLSGHGCDHLNCAVISAAFSPDGAHIVTASQDNTAKVWDADSGTELLTLSGHADHVNSAAFSPDGTRIVTASSDNTAKVWDADSGEEILTLAGHAEDVWSANFSPDGTHIVTGSEDSTARVWNANTGDELLTYAGHSYSVYSAAFSPDGERIITAGQDDIAKVWDANTGQELLSLKTSNTLAFPELAERAYHRLGGIHSAAFSPDGTRIVTANWDNTASVWQADTGQEVLTLSGHSDRVTSAAFSPDGTRIVTASWDNTVKVWNVDSGDERSSLSGHSFSVLSAVFGPDGDNIVTTSHDKTAKIWDADSGNELITFTGHTGSVFSAAFSPDGMRIVTASDDDTTRVWDANNGDQILTLPDGARSASFSPDGTRIVTAAKVWDADNGDQILTLPGAARSATFSPDGTRIVAASYDNTTKAWDVKVWDAIDGQELISLAGHGCDQFGNCAVNSAAFSPDGTRIVTASSDNTAKVWDATDGQELLSLAGHSDWVRSAAFSPDGTRIVTASSDNTAKVWLMPDALLEVALRKVQRVPPVFTEAEKARYGIGD